MLKGQIDKFTSKLKFYFFLKKNTIIKQLTLVEHLHVPGTLTKLTHVIFATTI